MPEMTYPTERAAILAALDRWIRQRPGLEFGNYGDVRAYNSELRSIGRDLREARALLRAVEWRDSIDAAALRAAFRAFSGRLSVTTSYRTDPDHAGTPEKPGQWTAELDYVTGQYWPTEYRKAACAVLASALWDRFRADTYDQKRPELEAAGKNYGDYIRAHFRREFGRGLASRWLD